MNAVADRTEEIIFPDYMRTPAVVSAVLHVAVFLLATFGLPNFIKPLEPTEMAMTVELVDFAEISQTNMRDEPQEHKDLEEPPPERKLVYNSSDSVPDLFAPQEPEVEELAVPVEKPKVDPTFIKKPPKPKNKPKPKKPKIKPPVEKKPEEKPKEEQVDINSLLRSVLNEADDAPSSPKEPSDKTGQISQIAQVSAKMLRSMESSLNNGVRKCWNVDAGGKNAETQIVEMQVYVNRDRTVSKVEFIDWVRYNADSHYKAAADAARRALLNRQCWPLQLPEDKYEIWKSFPYTFDPSGML